MSKQICIGEIINVHGIKGQVIVRSYADDASLFMGDEPLYDQRGARTFTFTKFAPHKNNYLATLDGVDTREAAEAIKGAKLYIDRNALPDTDDDEAYYVDLVGLKVTENGKTIGKVIAVQNFGASDLLEIQREKAKNFYLPFTDENILDVGDGEIQVSIPNGLMELYD